MKEVSNEKKSAMLDALRHGDGTVKAACAKVGISRTTYNRWKNEDPVFREEAEMIDLDKAEGVESKLMEKIAQGDVTCMIFFLKTKGRKIGYGNTEVADVYNCDADQHKPKANPVAMKRLGGIKSALIRVLKSNGTYSDGLKYQIDSVAQLMLRVEGLKQEIFDSDHKCVNVETSREGNVRESVNPKERLYLEYLRQMQYSLRALGLNMDSKAQKSTGDDGFDEFMKSMKE